MLELKLQGVSKRFQYEWIFKNLSLSLPPNHQIAVTGSNGSGKSTLLKCIAGQIPFTEGKPEYFYRQKNIPEADIYQFISMSAPYLELPEEYTLKEFLAFHFKFKKLKKGYQLKNLADYMYLEKSLHKPILYFSSGMKQRLKLGICFFSQSPLILLDEPTSDLDRKGVTWYQELIDTYGKEKSLVICSNDSREYSFCNRTLLMEDFKK